jgi:hypothetical protein
MAWFLSTGTILAQIPEDCFLHVQPIVNFQPVVETNVCFFEL